MSGEQTEFPRLEVSYDGKRVVLDFANFTGEDDLLLYQKTGLTLVDVFVGGKITAFSVAGLVWLEQRRANPQLTYEDVNRNFKMTALVDLSASEGAAAPEA